LVADANGCRIRNTLPRNGFANWRGAHHAQHAFSHPKIAILGTALVVRVWKTRSTTNDRAPKFKSFWIQGASEVPKTAPKMPVVGQLTLDVSAHQFGSPGWGTTIDTNCQTAKAQLPRLIAGKCDPDARASP
jgi:hypothetical protein